MPDIWGEYVRAAQTTWDAYAVITMRLMRLAGGGALAQREARRMIAEKVDASVRAPAAAAAAVMAGRSPRSAVKASAGVYKRKISANRRRLAGR